MNYVIHLVAKSDLSLAFKLREVNKCFDFEDINYFKNYILNMSKLNKIERIRTTSFFLRHKKFGKFLTVHDSLYNKSTESLIDYVHTLDLSLSDIKHVKIFSDVHTLDLSFTEVSDVSALSRVHTLNLCHTKVKDVSALGNVHTLDLSYTRVTDVSALRRVNKLNAQKYKITKHH
ncbi:MAG TPA: hypothetical protein VLE02_00885 [Nitrosarchaeum sp.]|nr:hypothetical protein [Nitrosarchaeum sp.]